jgi:drug/metabolite transporter (DMT)-like permease
MPIGELAALTTATLWCGTSLVFGEAARRIGSFRVNLFRLPLAFVLLSAALIPSLGALNTLNFPRLILLAISGVIGLAIGDYAYFGCIRRIGARLALILLALAPIFATFTSFLLLGEKLDRNGALGITITLLGVFWVALEKRDSQVEDGHQTTGVLLGIIAGACQGIGLVFAKMGMAGEVQPLAASWVRIGVAMVVTWTVIIGSGKVTSLDIRVSVHKAGWLVASGAVMGPFLGVWLSLVAARYTSVGVASTIMATNPVLIIPFVIVIERYRPSPRAILEIGRAHV